MTIMPRPNRSEGALLNITGGDPSGFKHVEIHQRCG